MSHSNIKFIPFWILVVCTSLCSWESSAVAFTNVIHVQSFQRSLVAQRTASSCRLGVNRKCGLRMESVDDLSKETPRIFGSRRFARAVSELQKAPTSSDVNRFLWSRRLFKAIQGFQSPESADFDVSTSRKVSGAPEGNPRTISTTAAADTRVEEEKRVHESASQVKTIANLNNVRKDDSNTQTNEQRPQLPELSDKDLALLARGERVQRQMRDGRVGTGMVVQDVEADIPLVFAVLTDIDRYPERISTVRKAVTYKTGNRLKKTQFQISKFRLQVNTELRCLQQQNMLEFTIDPERPAPFLEDATGFWFLEDVSSGAETRTRVWLVAGIACSALLPTAIVDYAASKALPRATTWVKPVMEELYRELKGLQDSQVDESIVEQFVREHVGSTVE